MLNNAGAFWESQGCVAGCFCLIFQSSIWVKTVQYTSRNSNRNKTSTHYKVMIQLWRLSIPNQGKSNIETRVKLRTFIHFCWRSFEGCFPTFVPALLYTILHINSLHPNFEVILNDKKTDINLCDFNWNIDVINYKLTWYSLLSNNQVRFYSYYLRAHLLNVLFF